MSIGERRRLSTCLDLSLAIGRATDLEAIYAAALDAIASGLAIHRASVLSFDDEGVMRFRAWRGLSEEYRRAVEGHSPWQRGQALAEPVVVADVASDPSLAALRPVIDAEGIGAMAFIPLVHTGGVIGKFMLYFDSPRTLDAEDLDFARLVAAQVALAIEGFRALREAADNQARLSFALDSANMGTWEWDLRRNSVRWSEGLERLHGMGPGEFDGSFETVQREIHPGDRARVMASIESAISKGAIHDVEYRIVTQDGAVRWVEGKGRVEYQDGAPWRMTGVCMDVTERKNTEAARLGALEESHRISRRLGAIVESSDDAIIAKDLNGIITSWNPAAERVFGYRAEEAIGRSVMFIIPDDRRAEEDLVMARIRRGEAVQMETVRSRKDGSRIDIALTISPVRDQNGTIVGSSKIARDITARKRSDAELARLHRGLTILVGASASLLESPDADAVRTATVGIARQLLDADGYAVWQLDEGTQTWRIVKFEGVSPEFAGRTIPHGDPSAPTSWDFLTPLAVRDVTSPRMLASQRENYEREGIRSLLVCPMRLGAACAGTLAFYYRQTHIFDDVEVQTAQALANMSAAAMNIADLYDDQRLRREAAESAGRQTAFLANAASVLATSPEYEQTLGAVVGLAVPDIADWCALDIVNDDGAIVRLAIAHVDPHKIELVRALEQRYPEDANTRGSVPYVIRTGLPALREHLPIEDLTAHARDDDHRRLLEQLAISSYMCVPLASPSGIFGAITFAFAESRRHYAPEDLRFAQDVATRASLAVENARAYRRTQEANRLKDEFLATLSHELRTPLNAILGYARMLQMRMLNGRDATQAVAVLTRNAEVLRQIIDDVLDVSRIVAGKLRLNVQPTALAAILKNAVATLRPAAAAKGVALEVHASDTSTLVSGDPDRLQQIAWNLLSNAVKFTPRGGRVRATLHAADSFVDLTVTDTGQGIDPDFLPHVFERFRQADSRFSRDHGGLGLGLSIVRELVQLHGGTVQASSEGLGKGSTFAVRLPLLLRKIDHAGKRRAPTTRRVVERFAAAPRAIGASTRKGRR